ncbi:nuclear transport factor 2 family protein [Mycolicibacterium pulveris]|uniref:nuclear transport factor 2 family protein n=1 Tax=Mycolicibacterium pulveris TaxID=36813 RepID=UPI003CEE8F33
MSQSDRLDRLESSLEIAQLPSRYAMALDARDLDAVVGLFVDDVDAGAQGTGRAALKQWYDEVYERRDGHWYFVKRREHPWYSVDVTERPGPEFIRWPTDVPLRAAIPHRMPTWRAFWDRGDPAVPARLSERP